MSKKRKLKFALDDVRTDIQTPESFGRMVLDAAINAAKETTANDDDLLKIPAIITVQRQVQGGGATSLPICVLVCIEIGGHSICWRHCLSVGHAETSRPG